MPVPNLITELSTTPSTNISFINGDVDSVAVTDSHLQTIYAFLKQIYDVSGTAALLRAQLDSQYLRKTGDQASGAIDAVNVAGSDFINSLRTNAGNVLNRWTQAGVVDWTVGLRANDTKFWVSSGVGMGNSQAYFDIAGGLSVAAPGILHDPYGAISVTKPNDANNYSYFGLTRSGQVGWNIGIRTDNTLFIGTGGAGINGVANNQVFRVTPNGEMRIGVMPTSVAPNGGTMNVSSLTTEQPNAVFLGRRNGIGFGIGAEFTGTGNTGAWLGAWRATNNYGATAPGALGFAINPEGGSVTIGNYWAVQRASASYVDIGPGARVTLLQNGEAYTEGDTAWGSTGVSINKVAGGATFLTLAGITVRAYTTNFRSISAGGTINASGADYAEYEIKGKNCGTIKKGDLVGFDESGQLTDQYDKAFSFGIKSTDPSYVGGDVWHQAVGSPPEIPDKEKFPEKFAEYEALKREFDAKMEAARERVDRVAYSGKVPLNLKGANVGDYIIAARSSDGGIEPRALGDLDFKDYMRAVGHVRRILQDGRCEVAVIVH